MNTTGTVRTTSGPSTPTVFTEILLHFLATNMKSTRFAVTAGIAVNFATISHMKAASGKIETIKFLGLSMALVTVQYH